jgi:VWFA-related protein
MCNLRKKRSLALLIILLLFKTSFGQTPSQRGTSSKEAEDAVVRITTNLVQVDVVVTDGKGRQVTDLKAEDFEIFEDGRTQKITNFSFVKVAPAMQPVDATPKDKKLQQVLPPVQLHPENISRTIAIVVDDLGLSFESINYVREAIKKFVDEQMQPGDLVAIIKTGGGIGVLQQFTYDKRQLYAAIKQLRYSFLNRAGVSAFDPVSNVDPKISSGRDNTVIFDSDIEESRRTFFTVGTLGAVNQVVNGLKQLPGRKAVVLFSDGFQLYQPDNPNNYKVEEAFRRLTDLANRAAVVTYTIDVRGLQTLGITAADNFNDFSSIQRGNLPLSGGSAPRLQDRITGTLDARRDAYYTNQQGLKYLAEATGGFFTIDVKNGIKQVLEEQDGYYLIGYDPDESTFDGKGRRTLHKLSVKVRRPGLSARTRGGFFGFPDEPRKEAPVIVDARSEQLRNALISPFSTNGVPVSLTPLFLHDKKQGTLLRALLQIDSSSLSFTEEADGWHRCELDLLAVTFGADWKVVDQINRSQAIRLRGDSYESVLKDGFAYILDVPIKKAGAYQFRVAVRDSKSERVGSANQFVDVPDIKKGKLALSGILTSGSESDPTSQSESEKLILTLRKFKRGMALGYSYFIYNAQLNNSIPQLRTQARLFYNGREIYTGKVQPFDPARQADVKRLVAGGRLSLGTDLEPGEYALQIIVTDDLSKEKNRTAAQWISFEIVE